MDESELKTALNELKADLVKYPLVYALAAGDSLTDALKKAGRSKTWYYELPDDEQTRLTEIATALKTAPLVQAKTILDDAVVDAAKVKVGGLTNRDPRIQQPAATEILDRTIGKAPNPIELTGAKGQPITIKWDDSDD